MAQCIRIISITFYIRSISITRPLPHSFIQSLNDKLPSSFYVFGSYRGPSEHLVGITHCLKKNIKLREIKINARLQKEWFNSFAK